MNIDRISSFAYEAFKSGTDKRRVDNEDKRGQEKKPPIQDNYIKNDNFEKPVADIKQLTEFAKSAPDIREEKISEIRQKISEGYFLQDSIVNALAERVAGIV
jgi:hypothetical protein